MVSPNKGNRQAEAMRAAAKLFGKYGFENTSIRDIAAEAGMLPGSMYYHFESKNELLYELHRCGMEELKDAVEAALAKKRNPWSRLSAAAEAHVAAILNKEGFAGVTVGGLPLADTELRDRLTGMRDSYEDIFRQLVAELPIPSYVNRKYLRLSLLGALNFVRFWAGASATTGADIAQLFEKLMRTKPQQIEKNAAERQMLRIEPYQTSANGDGPAEGGRRGDIMQAGARLFIECGYKATTMRDIANETDMIAGSIYYHFKSKADLLLAILEESSALSSRVLENACEGLVDPWDRLEAVCAAHLLSLLGNSNAYASPIVLQVMPVDDPRLTAAVENIRQASEQRTQEIIGDLPLPAGSDKHLFYMALFGAINSVRVWYKPHRDSPREIAHHIVELFRMP